MDEKTWIIFLLLISSCLVDAWRSSNEDRRQKRDPRRSIHNHSKRHMALNEMEPKRRSTTGRPLRDVRKKPSGQLTPLEEDDMENDEVVSVAIGPPPIRPKYDKTKQPPKTQIPANLGNNNAENLVKDVLAQLGREFLTKQVSEDFVFGQYVGIAMKNLASELKLKLQHEILEIIVKYQSWNRNGETTTVRNEEKATPIIVKDMVREISTEKKINNDTDDSWPDFTNLAKIVG